VVQRSDRIDPSLDYLSCPVGMVGPIEDGGLNSATPVMTHNDDMTDSEFCHAVREDGSSVRISTRVLVRNVAFGEEDARGGREYSSFGDSGIATRVMGCW
jgi:hypothetical protein